MVRSNAIEIVCGDLYSAKVNFAGDRPYSDPYMSFTVKTKINVIEGDGDGAYLVDNKSLYGKIAVNGVFIGSSAIKSDITTDDDITFNLPIEDSILEIPDWLTDKILPTRTDYDIFVSVPTGDSSTGHYTPVYRNVIEFLPRTNKIL